MGFWKSLFGGEEDNTEEAKRSAEDKNFDLLKYDGVKALRMNQVEYAEKCFREALKIHDDLETHDYLQQTLIRQGRLEDALAELKVMTAAAPDNVPVLMQAAHVAYMLEDYPEMQAICEQALAVAPDHAMANYQLAQAALGQGDLVGTIARLTKAIATDESLADARLLRSKVLMRMGDLKGAGEDVDWLLAHTTDEEDVLLQAARLMHAKGDDDAAINIYNKVIDLNPFQMDAYGERGKIRYDRGDKQGAEEDMQKVLELNPNALADVSGEYSAEGIEEKVKKAYTILNPFGL
ncbi:MAG: tetratricopeptide repeat protein [Prevotella sp.]|nr:tetratricopeptide repeat protein [Prevotella sp.]